VERPALHCRAQSGRRGSRLFDERRLDDGTSRVSRQGNTRMTYHAVVAGIGSTIVAG